MYVFGLLLKFVEESYNFDIHGILTYIHLYMQERMCTQVKVDDN